MAKAKKEELNLEAQAVFYDRTDKSWYASKKENKITVCESIEDIINGKGETYEFSTSVISSRTVSKNEKEVEKNNFILFHLADGNSLLLRPWKELK